MYLKKSQALFNFLGIFCFIGLCIAFPLKIIVMMKVLYITFGPRTMIFRYLVYFLLNIFILLTLFLINRRRLVWLYYLVATIYLIVRSIYFMYFNVPFSISQSFLMIGESGTLLARQNFIFPLATLLLFADLPFFIGVVSRMKVLRSKIFHNSFQTKIIFLILIIGLIMIHIVAYTNRPLKILWGDQEVLGPATIVKNFGFIPYEIIAAYRSFNPIKTSDAKAHYSDNVFLASNKTKHPNIFCLQLESVDAAVINLQYNGQYVMPYLHSLSQKHIYYPFMVSYHGIGGTADTEFSLINSTLPTNTQFSMKLDDYPNSIFKRLNSYYETKIFHNNIEEYDNRKVSFPKMGVEEYIGFRHMKLKEYGWGACDHDVFKYILDMLKNKHNPYFYYYITMSSHIPFTYLPKNVIEHDFDGVKNTSKRHALQAFRYVDRQIQFFINSIDRSNTYFFIYGDHNVPLAKLNDFPLASIILDGRVMEFVPLIILSPNNQKYREERYAISFLDMAPTILSLSGIKSSIRTDGMDLLTKPFPINHPDLVTLNGKKYSAGKVYDLMRKKLD